MNHDNKQHGFTLIELMLAMTFISILLLAIAMTTIQISNIYNKGITMREVNQMGRAISDELQRSIGSSTPFDVTPKDSADNSATNTSHYVVRKANGQNVAGRLCLGDYTYAWNYGKAIAGEGGITSYNKYTGGDSATPIRFVKVRDPSGALCSDPTMNITKANATEMLSSGDRDLVVHNFSIVQTKSDAATSQAIYAISVTIGTNDREQLTANDASCKPPAQGVGDENYCSVNQFDIIARAGNKSEGGN